MGINFEGNKFKWELACILPWRLTIGDFYHKAHSRIGNFDRCQWSLRRIRSKEFFRHSAHICSFSPQRSCPCLLENDECLSKQILKWLRCPLCASSQQEINSFAFRRECNSSFVTQTRQRKATRMGERQIIQVDNKTWIEASGFLVFNSFHFLSLNCLTRYSR